MKILKTIFTFLLTFLVWQAFAQEDIFDARNAVGEEVTVSGIATNGSELGNIRYFQDNTAGLAAYGSELSSVNRGDSITVTGTVKEFNNLLEMDPITSVIVHSSSNTLPAPVILTINQLGEPYESQLIEIKNVTIVNASGTFAGNQNYEITDGTDTGEFRVNTNSPIVGEVIPTGKINLIGICSQYYSTYQILPRDMNDIVSAEPVNFISPVMVKEITTTSVALYWETDVDASTEIRFGPGQDKSQWESLKVEFSAPTTNGFSHEINIADFDPASIFYAEAFSVLESDTAFSSVGVFATQSESTGKINVYFNTEVDSSVSSGIPAQDIGSAMEDTIIAYINRSRESIDFCIYNINNSGLSNVSEALNAAKNRGVSIRFITDGSTNHFGTQELNTEIPVLERPEIQNGGIMHNKFAVFDANTANPNQAWVWTGSTNISFDQIYSDANNSIFIQDQTLAKCYQLEFEEMWGSTGNQPNVSNAKFGPDKSDNTPHEFIIGGNRFESYFSPSDNTNQKIISAINTADDNLNIETMLITRTDLALAIVDAAGRHVDVNIITNYEGDNTASVNTILNDNLSPERFVFDDLANGILHNKFAVIDVGDTLSDPQVITGSHNWSNSANDKNDENTLIIHSSEIANLYYQQFVYRFEENGGILIVSANATEMANIKIYPNPAVQQITISSPHSISSVQLYSLSGKLIHERANVNSNQMNLQMQNKIAGIYILKVKLQNGKENTFKIVKR